MSRANTTSAVKSRTNLHSVHTSARRQLWAAYAIGVLGYAAGLVLSALFDLPSGAMIVWTLAGCALLAQAIPGMRRHADPAAEVADLAP